MTANPTTVKHARPRGKTTMTSSQIIFATISGHTGLFASASEKLLAAAGASSRCAWAQLVVVFELGGDQAEAVALLFF